MRSVIQLNPSGRIVDEAKLKSLGTLQEGNGSTKECDENNNFGSCSNSSNKSLQPRTPPKLRKVLHENVIVKQIGQDDSNCFVKLSGTSQTIDSKRTETSTVKKIITNEKDDKLSYYSSTADASQEDFSFQNLRQKTVNREKSSVPSFPRVVSELTETKICASEEDFSFQTLKEKALNREKSAVKSDARVDCAASSEETNENKHLVMKEAKYSNMKDKHTKESDCTPSKKTSAKSDKKDCMRSCTGSTTQESYTPNRRNKYYKPRIRREEVEATDMSQASVQKLSQWLADKPFEKQKNPVIVRKGAHVAKKARVFEKGTSADAIIDSEKKYFPSGKVSDGKKWLINAFKASDEIERSNDEDPATAAVYEKVKMLESAFKPKRRASLSGLSSCDIYGESNCDYE